MSWKPGFNTYDFAVELMFLDHNRVDTFRVLEREEAKATRSASSTVAHDGTLNDLSELCEVISQ